MSVRIMSRVWYSDLAAEPKYVLLALADHADDEGRNAYPSKRRLAAKTGLSERTVQRHLSHLRGEGILEVTDDPSHHRPTTYRIRGDRLAPLPESGETDSTRRGDRFDTSGETPVSPESSVEPSVEPSTTGNGSRRRPVDNGRTKIKNAIVAACEWAPESMTKRAWGRVEEAAKDLNEIGATPDEIRSFGLFWPDHYPGADLTPQAIAGNWPAWKNGRLFERAKRR